MKELGVGVIGCGTLAQSVHLPNLRQLDGARLAWACDVDPTVLAHVARRFQPQRTTTEYAEVLADPTVAAIVLATAQDIRLPVIEAAARAGKAVYCEKPMANTIDEMERIRRVVEDAGIVFCVGHNRRSAPSMLHARGIFRRQRTSPAPCRWRLDRNSALRNRWPEEDQACLVIRINDDLLSWKPWVLVDAILVGGPMLWEMTHFTDIACWLLGERPVAVAAVGHHRANHTVVITFEDGSIATIVQTGVGTFGYPKELYEMYCNGSVVVLDHFVEVRTGGIEGEPARRDFPLAFDPLPEVSDGGGIRDYYAKRREAERRGASSAEPQAAVLDLSPQPDKGHRVHLARFLDAVRGAGQSPCTCREAIVATRLAFAALESLKTGRTIELP